MGDVVINLETDAVQNRDFVDGVRVLGETTKSKDGVVRRYNQNKELHAIGQPAVMYEDGSQSWVVDGVAHRDGYGPSFFRKRDQILKWRKDGYLHNEYGPAYIDFKRGIFSWYINDQLHNEHGPAYIDKQLGVMVWYRKGIIHNDTGPAYINNQGYLWWYKDGHIHRDGGEPSVITPYARYWTDMGVLTRGGPIGGERGQLPAIEHYDGSLEYYFMGERHRLEGPAVILTDGTKKWYVHGKEYTEEEFEENGFSSILKGLCKSKSARM